LAYKRPVSKNRTFSEAEKIRIVVEGQSSGISLENLCAREGISLDLFQEWTKNFLISENMVNGFQARTVLPDSDTRYKVVLEGQSGMTSVAEICRRENIDQDTFLEWSREFLALRQEELEEAQVENPAYLRHKELISGKYGQEVFEYLQTYINFSNRESFVATGDDFISLGEEQEALENVVTLKRVNDIRYINKYFEDVNSKLKMNGVFAGCLETFHARKSRKRINRIPVLNNIYFTFEFILKRIIPKLSLTKKYYFDITKGNDRLLSKAEGLGRLVSCGFDIMDFKSIDGLLFFVVKKVGEPKFDMSPSYGPVYKMPRLGKNGKIIGVYKFRTMHPYSEYLQDYIVRAHGYAETGKPANDFRIPKWGKILRRFWMDELPQLYNFVRGDIKLVGIRPVSERYFQDIPKEMQKLRLTQKPGCIPPYVSLNRDGNVMSVLQAEKEYLEEKIRNPFTTDIKYFFKAIFNIVFKHKRSA
jgi:lipopolysaccharide/colanic/teichoic acid biosynthesis glycosyltransferase/transposase-like protein